MDNELQKIIARAIPVDLKCAIQEAYNKERRRWLKEKIELYIAEQLEFNAKRPNEDQERERLGTGGQRPVEMSEV